MNCRQSDHYMMKYFDGNLNDIEHAQLKTHLKTCKKCSIDFNELNDIFSNLNNESTPEPPQDFQIKVMEKISSLEVDRRKHAEKIIVILYCIANVVLMGLVMMLMLNFENMVLKPMEQMSSSSGVIYTFYSALKSLYSFGETIKEGIRQVISITNTLYYYIFVTIVSILLMVKIDYSRIGSVWQLIKWKKQ